MTTNKPPRVWWLKNGMAYEYQPDGHSWDYEVVERSYALQLEKELARAAEFANGNHARAEDALNRLLARNEEIETLKAKVARLEKALREIAALGDTVYPEEIAREALKP